MEVTKATVAILAAACVTAGAAGGYIITRDPLPAAGAESAADPVSEPFATPAVEHSEGRVTDEATLPPVEAVKARPPAPPRRPQAPPPVPAPQNAVTNVPAPLPLPEVVPPPPAVEPVRPVEEPVRAVIEPVLPEYRE